MDGSLKAEAQAVADFLAAHKIEMLEYPVNAEHLSTFSVVASAGDFQVIGIEQHDIESDQTKRKFMVYKRA